MESVLKNILSDSNTTLVKVKYIKQWGAYGNAANSNTTLVKVK